MSAPILSSRMANRLRAGFSLITASIVIAVAALVFASMLPGDTGSNNQKTIDNVHKLERVEEAMRAFMAKNGRRPCPADGQYAFNTANFGLEAATPGTCTGGTPAAPLGPDVGTGHIVGGVIPTKTLGLPDDYAVDQFGHRFAYVVDIRATSNSSCFTLGTTGGINIKNTANTGGTLLAKTMYAYISFGKSGYGAYPANGSAAGPSHRINSGSTDGDMQTNAGVDAHFPGASAFTYNTTNWTNTLVQKAMVAPTSTDTGFDDVVWYRNDTKNTCALGPIAKGPGFRIDGNSTYPNLGMELAVGDINGDGIPDLVIGPWISATNGYVAVVFGTASGFPDPLPLSSLNGTNGFILKEATAGDDLGQTIAVGDFNGDGKADIMVSAGNAGYSFATSGSVYVIYGGSTMKNGTAWSTCPCMLTAGGSVINGTNGFRIDGATATDGLGGGKVSLAIADINGDGNTDLIIGDQPANFNGLATSGSVYVIYGNGAGAMKDGTAFAQTQTLALGTKPLDGTNGYRLDGASTPDFFGYSLAVADFNGDSKNDLIIAAPHAGYNGLATSGSVYVIYGTGANLMPSGTITTANSSAAATVNSFAGLEVGMYINTPKTAGLYISACGGGTTCTSTSITLSGNATGVQTAVAYTVDAARVTSGGTLIDGTHGFRLDGATAGDQLASPIAVGDLNGDGKADLVLDASNAAYNGATSGSVYVVYGGAAGKFYDATALAATQKLTSASKPIDGTNGYRLDGASAGDALGTASVVGDVNGDGKADLVIGAKTTAAGGSVYVIYGNGAGAMKDGTAFGATRLLSAAKPIDGSNGFRIDARVATERLGNAVALCDVNNDGKTDLIMGGNYGTAGGSSPYFGSTYILNGSFIPTITTSTYGVSNLCTGSGC